MAIFALGLLVLAIVSIDVPKLIIEKRMKELAVYSFFMLVGTYLAMVQLFDWPFYNAIEEFARMANGKNF